MYKLACGIATLLLFVTGYACGGACTQVKIDRDAKYYSLTCPTKGISDKCTVNATSAVGTLTPKDDKGNDRVFTSTGEWHLKTTESGGTADALSGTQFDILMDGNHYVVDANDGHLVLTNNPC